MFQTNSYVSRHKEINGTTLEDTELSEYNDHNGEHVVKGHINTEPVFYSNRSNFRENERQVHFPTVNMREPVPIWREQTPFYRIENVKHAKPKRHTRRKRRRRRHHKRSVRK
jgi:hypothetical protein